MKKWIGKFYSDLVGISFTLVGIITLLSLISYHPQDPSFNHLTWIKANNLCGLIGSFWSDGILHLFGLASWLWVPYFGVNGINGLRGRILSSRDIQIIPTMALILLGAGLLGAHFDFTSLYDGKIPVGGFVGDLISRGLERILNTAGSKIVLWVSVITMTILISQKSFKDWVKILSDFFSFLFGRFFEGRQKLESSHLDHYDALVSVAGQTGSKERDSKNILQKITGRFPLKKKKSTDVEKSVDTLDEQNFDGANSEGDEEESEDLVLESPSEDEVMTPKRQKRKVVLKSKIPAKIAQWNMPKLNLLEDPPATRAKVDKEELKRKAEQLTDKLKLFNVTGNVVAVKSGPAVTMFEFKPNAEVKLSHITSMENDLAIALSSESLRIIAPIPGRDVVGIESSNTVRETVYLKDILAEENFWKEDIRLPIALGRQTNGDPQIVDLRKMPHLLVAGSTGSGKSVFTVSTIIGLLFRHSPKTLRLILIDPKQVDLTAFSQIPHLLLPPIVETPKAVAALRWAVKEMDKRYRSMSKFAARGLEAYNETVSKLTEEEKEIHRTTNDELEDKNKKNQKYYFEELPYLVIVVEEFGDLMQVDSDNVEQSVVRLAQLARACGIHLMLCMQSPRKEIVTGLIKTNIPGRISFKVASKMDSRIILDEAGAERLLARGDMLFRAPGTDKPMRHHGPWLSDPEINQVAQFWTDQSEPQYDEHLLSLLEDRNDSHSGSGEEGDSGDGDFDEMYDEIVAFTSNLKEVSASLIQRRFRLGYPRAARLIELMEKEGVIGGSNGSKPRQVLVKSYQNN